jgi:hypothetical protein
MGGKRLFTPGQSTSPNGSAGKWVAHDATIIDQAV